MENTSKDATKVSTNSRQAALCYCEPRLNSEKTARAQADTKTFSRTRNRSIKHIKTIYARNQAVE